MSLDKVLHKIQAQINELAPLLEVFVDETIQPSVSDCQKLQDQLTALQENLAVYKYDKLNKEISPSFNIHAKVSAAEKTEDRTVPPPDPIRQQPVEIKQEIPKQEEIKSPEIKTEQPVKQFTPTQRSPLSIGINDKFRFIKTLFSDNSSEYNIAIEQLNVLRTRHEMEVYLNSLKNLYHWNDDNETVKSFYLIVKRRLD